MKLSTVPSLPPGPPSYRSQVTCTSAQALGTNTQLAPGTSKHFHIEDSPRHPSLDEKTMQNSSPYSSRSQF